MAGSNRRACDANVCRRIRDKKIVAFSGRQIWIVPNVVPGNIVRNSYVFVDDTNLRDGVAYAMYNGAMINYAFPTRLSALKDVLFSAGSVRVLR